MKKIKFSILSLALFSLLFSSCRPEEAKEVGELFTDRTSALSGTWKTSKVIQTDLRASENSNRTLDITNVMNAGDLQFTFNQDRSFTIASSTTDTAPNFTGISTGNWQFNTINGEEETGFPSAVWLNPEGSIKLDLGSAPRPDFDQVVIFTRIIGGRPSISYTYTLTKVN